MRAPLVGRPAWIDRRPGGPRRVLQRVEATLDPVIVFAAGQRPAGPWRIGVAAGDIGAALKTIKVWETGNPSRLRHQMAAARMFEGAAFAERVRQAAPDVVAPAADAMKAPWFLADEEGLDEVLADVLARAGVPRSWTWDGWCARLDGLVDIELGA